MQKKAYDVKASASIAILGCIGVVVAATIVKSLPVYALKWLVVAVVLFTSYTMFRSYRGRKQSSPQPKEGHHAIQSDLQLD
jgi:uncharacterized membrane protein YfcA